jgi:hypothetical protein
MVSVPFNIQMVLGGHSKGVFSIILTHPLGIVKKILQKIFFILYCIGAENNA